MTKIQTLYGTANREELVAMDLANRKRLQNELGHQIAQTPGFFEAEDPALPAVVARAAKSVFLITAIQARPRNPDAVFTIERAERLLEFYRQGTDPEYRPRASMGEVYLNECKRKRAKDCYIPAWAAGYRNQASAFVMKDSGTEILTSQHFFQNMKQNYRERHCRPGKMRHCEKFLDQYDLFLLDSEGRPVADPFNNRMRLMAIGTSNQQKDFAVFRTDRRAGPGLKAAVHRPVAGERVYHIGFPACTGCLDGFDAGTASTSLMVRGTRYPHRDAVGEAPQVTMGEYVEVTNAPGMLAVAADGASGMSGGVTLNAAGEVLGILIGLNAEKIEGTDLTDRITYTVPLSVVQEALR